MERDARAEGEGVEGEGSFHSLSGNESEQLKREPHIISRLMLMLAVRLTFTL